MEEEYEVLIGEDEEKLYQDNCVSVEGKCPRNMVVGGTDQKWLKAAQERIENLEKSKLFAERREERKKKVAEKLKKIRDDAAASVVREVNPEVVDDTGEEFKAPRSAYQSQVVPTKKGDTRSTRSTSASASISENERPKSTSFPDKTCRSSFKNIDPDIVEVMLVMESKYKVEQRQVAPLLAYIMNTLGGQNWEAPTEKTEILETESENNDIPRRKKKDLSHVLPSRKAIRSKLQVYG